jgi:site-specific DNA recombinase
MTTAAPPVESRGRVAVVGYCRVSTETQAEQGLGLPIQQDQINAFCKKNPQYRLDKIYTDAGISGSTLEKRPALQELLRDAKQHRFTKVIVAKMDRLARDLYVQLFAEKELLVSGVEVISVSESFNGNDPLMVAMRQIVGTFAQLERARITERLLSGRRKKLSNGGYAGGKPPTGYVVKNSRLVVDEKEAAIVKEVFRLRMGRNSMKKIADKLNSAGMKPKYGKRFYASTVQYMLQNPAYKGIIRYGGAIFFSVEIGHGHHAASWSSVA